MLHGNMCVGVAQTSLIVRLGPEQADAARRQPYVVESDVAGHPLKGWGMIEAEGLATDAQLGMWIGRAVHFVESEEVGVARYGLLTDRGRLEFRVAISDDGAGDPKPQGIDESRLMNHRRPLDAEPGPTRRRHPWTGKEPDPTHSPGQLFQFDQDPTESTNVYRLHPEKLAELTQLFQEIRQSGRSRHAR